MGPEQIMWWPWAGMWIFPMIMFAVIIICCVFICRATRGVVGSSWSGPGRYHGEGGESDRCSRHIKKALRERRNHKRRIRTDEERHLKLGTSIRASSKIMITLLKGDNHVLNL